MGQRRKYTYFGKEGLLGGVNLSDNEFILQPPEMSVADNVFIGQTLGRKKRPGQENYHTSTYASTASWPASSAAIRGLVQYWRYATNTNESTEDLFLHHDNKVWSIANRTSEAVNRTGSLVLSASARPNYQVFEGVLFFTSSETGDGYNKWDGTLGSLGDAVAATGPADGNGKYISTYKGTMMMGGVNEFPFRLYRSDTLNAEAWSGGNSTSFDIDYDGDPDGITGLMGEFQGKFYFGTRTSIYELSGNDTNTYAVSRITRGIGIASNSSIVQTPNDIIWASDRGVHSLRKTITSDQTEISFLSRDIQTFFTDDIDGELISRAEGVYDDINNLYLLTFTREGQSTHDWLLVYNINFNVWTIWKDVDARSLAKILIENEPRILAGGESGTIRFFNKNKLVDDNFNQVSTSGFSTRIKTARLYPGGDLSTQKRFHYLTLMITSKTTGTISVGYDVDGLEGQISGSKSFNLSFGQPQWDNVSWDISSWGGQRAIPLTVTVAEVGYSIAIEIVVTGNMDFELLGYMLEVEDVDKVVK